MNQTLGDIPWAKRLKLRHFETFLLLEAKGSITAAAEALHLTPPAVSHWISDLEEVTGMKLFVRGRKLQITSAGEVFKGYAMRTIGDAQRTHLEFASLRLGATGRVHIGTVLSAALVFLPKVTACFRARFPYVVIEIVEGNFDSLLDMMNRREVDLILGALDSRAPVHLAASLLMRDDTVVVAHPDHPVHQGKASWSDVLAYAWILPPHGTLTYTTFKQSTLQAKVPTPAATIETSSIITQQALLQSKEYLALLTRSMAEYYEALGLLKIVPLKMIKNTIPLGAMWDEATIAKPARQFVDSLKTEFSP